MQVYLQDKVVKLDPRKIIGSGGEADVFRIANGLALKVFKSPSHPDFSGDAIAQKVALEKIQEHQRKLREFPAGLPAQVITPIELATDSKGQIIGYTMKLVDAAEMLIKYGD
jgi:hypothetical protein